MAAAIQQPPLPAAARIPFLWLDLAVLAVKDGGECASGRGQGRIDQRPEVVGVDHIRSQPAQCSKQRRDCAGREACAFAEHIDLIWNRQACGKVAGGSQAGHMGIHRGNEPPGDIDHAILSPPRAEGIKDVQNTQGSRHSG
jgi:hypothetical protein